MHFAVLGEAGEAEAEGEAGGGEEAGEEGAPAKPVFNYSSKYLQYIVASAGQVRISFLSVSIARDSDCQRTHS